MRAYTSKTYSWRRVVDQISRRSFVRGAGLVAGSAVLYQTLGTVASKGIATLSYLPSTVFPTGLSKEGLPIGLQVIGAEFDDQTTMAFAHLLAEEIGGFTAPPGYGS